MTRDLRRVLPAVPAVVFLVAFVVVPTVSIVIHAFTPGPGVSGGLGANFVAAFGDAGLRQSMLNSVVVCLLAVGLALAVTIPTLLWEAKRKTAGRHPSSLATALLTAPIALPGIVIGFLGIVMAGRTGVTSLIPGGAGFTYTVPGLIVAYVYFTLPRLIGPLRGAVEALDHEAEEAAQTVGGSRWFVFRTVTFPLLVPAMADACGSALAVALGGYGTVATLSEGVRLLPLDTVDALTNSYNLGLASALAVVLAVLAIGFRLLGGLVASLSPARLGEAKR